MKHDWQIIILNENTFSIEIIQIVRKVKLFEFSVKPEKYSFAGLANRTQSEYEMQKKIIMTSKLTQNFSCHLENEAVFYINIKNFGFINFIF